MPSRMFSRTSMESKSAPFWKTYPMRVRKVFALERRDVQAIDRHDPGIGRDESDDVLEQDALPHTGGPQERDGLAIVHVEVHVVEHHVIDEALGDILELDHWPVPVRRICVRSTSSRRMEIDAETTALVVARPTPSAPCWVL